METLTANKRGEGVTPTNTTKENELGETIVYNDLSVNDIMGWTEQDSNRHYSHGVKELLEAYERLEKTI